MASAGTVKVGVKVEPDLSEFHQRLAEAQAQARTMLLGLDDQLAKQIVSMDGNGIVLRCPFGKFVLTKWSIETTEHGDRLVTEWLPVRELRRAYRIPLWSLRHFPPSIVASVLWHRLTRR